MNKLSVVVLLALACSSAQAADREYSKRQVRDERRVDACVDDYTRGERVSRKQMKKIEDQCRRTSAKSQDYQRDRQLDRERQLDRQRSSSMPDGSPQGRNLRGVPDTSGPP
jgi:hypothetical protein